MTKKNEPDLETSRSLLMSAMALLDGMSGGTHGNISCRTGKLEFLIKPSGVKYSEMSPDKFCRVRVVAYGPERVPTVDVIEGELRPSVDTVHHAALYVNHPWLRSICHTHSDYVVAHAICGSSIECMSTEQADVFGGAVPCLSYEDFESWGQRISLHKEGVPAVLLTRHGGLTFADAPSIAVELAQRLEDVARKNVLARIVNTNNPSALLPTEVAKWHKRFKNDYGQK